MDSKNEKLFIHHHLGLGDHYMCCGLVRHLVSLKEYKFYLLACKENIRKNVLPLYADLSNLKVLKGHPETADTSLYDDLPSDCDKLKIGFNNLAGGGDIDESFYRQVDIPLDYKWSKFHVERNLQKEEECFEEEVKSSAYIFVNDHSSKGSFDFKINNSLPIVRPTNTEYLVSDYLKVIENAREIHCLNSSFLNLIDLMCDQKGMYFHNVQGNFNVAIDKKKWKFVNDYEK